MSGYVVSVMAMSRRNGAFYVHHTPVQISAESDAEANELAMRIARRRYPSRDGWRWHSAEVMRIRVILDPADVPPVERDVPPVDVVP